MALELSGSINISGSMTATTIIVSAPGAPGMVSSSAQITELAPLMAYTASLKTAAIVSSSQQIENYFTFARTGSANTFYGNQTITGSLFISGSGGNPSQVIQIIRDTLGNGTVVEEGNMAITILSAPGQTKLAMGASNAGNYGYIQAMQDGTSWNNRSLTLQPRGGDVTISNGNLVIGTSGKGIDFSATSNSFSGSMTSELLNDYEEGTWTPVITDLTNDATMDGTYTRGSYIKIGKQVTVRGYILTTSLGSVTGNVKIKGLPFTNGGGFASLGGGSIGTASGLNITAGHSVHISTPIGANYLGLNVGDDATGTTEMTAAEWSADGQIQMLATYFVD
jgi:hypothetical protein